MELEVANTEDHQELLRLSKAQMKRYFDENSLEWNENKQKKYLDESQVFRILDPDFSGYLQLCEKGNELFIYNLQILPACQGQGLGTKVVNHVIEMAKGNGTQAVRLGSFKSNRASSLYERLGFQAIKENGYFVWYIYAIT